MARRKKSEGAFVGGKIGWPLVKATALQIMDESGPGGLSMRRIASRIGCSPTALYNYVSGIDHVCAWVAEDLLERLLIEMYGERERHEGAALLLAQASVFRAFWRRNPQQFGFVFARYWPHQATLEHLFLGRTWHDLPRVLGSKEEAGAWWARLHGIIALEHCLCMSAAFADQLWERAMTELEAAAHAAQCHRQAG
jgi:AcrR family transcriptional regulator